MKPVLINLVLLSSRERTTPPSAFEEINSYNPLKPEMETSLLYSIVLNFVGSKDK